MQKRLSTLLALLVLLAMVVGACGAPAAPAAAPADAAPADAAPADAAPADAAAAPADSGKTVLDVWSFTNEINTMAIAFEAKHPDVDIKYTMIPMTNGEFQTKLKAALGTADAPDVMALEAAFVKSYVESDILADLSDLMPAAEAANTYPFVTDVGSNDGVIKAFAYQATPGALFYRRSLAKEYFGTDDPTEIQALLSDMDKYTAAAEVVKEKSDGNTFMVASSGDFQNLFFANREQPWIVDDELVVDPMVEKYVETAKLFRDNGYEAQAQQWQEGWFAGMNDSLVDANGNPKQAKEFIQFATLDEENLKNWATGVYTNDFLKAIDPDVAPDQMQAAGDFVSSQNVVEEIIPLFDDSELSAFLGGQNSYAGFAEAAPSVNAKLMTGADDAIQRAMNDPINQYLNGEISLDDMWASWKDGVRIEFPDLIIN
jgi:hypothetical protein